MSYPSIKSLLGIPLIIFVHQAALRDAEEVAASAQHAALQARLRLVEARWRDREVD